MRKKHTGKKRKKTAKKSDLSWLSKLTIPKDLSSADYEFKGDREALRALKAVPGAGWLFSRWVRFWLEFRKTGFLGSTVRVSEKQFPELDRLRRKAAEVLGIEPPPLFVVEQPVLNAFTMGTSDEDSFVAITRPLLEATTDRELLFILGHEFGHIRSQHALYATLAIYIANMGLFYGMRFPGVNLLIYPIELALKAWFRRSEISCDRAGLICAQDLEAGRRALLLLACGSRELADRVDLDEFRDQSAEVSGSYGKWSELFLTHPYLPKRVACLELFGESHVYLRRVLKDRKKSFLSPEDLDKAVAKVLGDEEPILVRTVENTDAARLKVSMALAGAWADGRISVKERGRIEGLLATLDLKKSELKRLRGHLDEPFSIDAALREVRYHAGIKTVGLPFAFQTAQADGNGVGFQTVKTLLALCEGAGLTDLEAESVCFDVGARKRFFRERAGVEYCSLCGEIYQPGEPTCPSCSEDMDSTQEPEGRRVMRLSDRLMEAGKTAGTAAAGAAGSFLSIAAAGLGAAAEFLDEAQKETEPAGTPAPKKRSQKKKR